MTVTQITTTAPPDRDVFDCLYRELKMGDWVNFSLPYSHAMYPGRVVKISPKKIGIRYHIRDVVKITSVYSSQVTPVSESDVVQFLLKQK